MRAWKKTYQRLPESELDIMLVLWNNTPPMNRMEIVAAGEGDEESRVLYNNGDGIWIGWERKSSWRVNEKKRFP